MGRNRPNFKDYISIGRSLVALKSDAQNQETLWFSQLPSMPLVHRLLMYCQGMYLCCLMNVLHWLQREGSTQPWTIRTSWLLMETVWIHHIGSKEERQRGLEPPCAGWLSSLVGLIFLILNHNDQSCRQGEQMGKLSWAPRPRAAHEEVHFQLKITEKQKRGRFETFMHQASRSCWWAWTGNYINVVAPDARGPQHFICL